MEPRVSKARKSRSSGLRTRSGCITCRKRHKKCDEKRPICGPCSLSSGRICTFSQPGSSPRDDTAASGGPRLATERQTSCLSQETVLPVLGTNNRSSPPFIPRQVLNLAGLCDQLSQNQSFATTSTSLQQYTWSPVGSDLLPVDLATTRWLDLLATDAAQADCTFSLAPSPLPESNHPISQTAYDGDIEVIDTQAQRPVVNTETTSGAYQPYPSDLTLTRNSSWQCSQDIVLLDTEAALFRVFAERAASWMDLFDPHKHFSTYVIRLALRNHGLMKAVLALTSRYTCIVNTNKGEDVDPNTAVQYYYETLHYLQNALRQDVSTYSNSEELLAIAMIISTYEMLDLSSSSDWNRHLKGIFWLQRSQEIHGASGGLRQAVWWLWLRQDLWAAFREGRTCYSFWRPTKDLRDMLPDELAGFSIYLLSQAVNNCAMNSQDNLSMQRDDRGHQLAALLAQWKSCLGPEFVSLPTTVHGALKVFQPLWIHPPAYASALQVHSFATILVVLHCPSLTMGFSAYMKTQKILSDAVATICGIAEELRAEECQIMSAQCLFGAGLCVEDRIKRERILVLIKACEERTGWSTSNLRSSLKEEWDKAVN